MAYGNNRLQRPVEVVDVVEDAIKALAALGSAKESARERRDIGGQTSAMSLMSAWRCCSK